MTYEIHILKKVPEVSMSTFSPDSTYMLLWEFVNYLQIEFSVHRSM